MNRILICRARRACGASLLALVAGMSACRQDTPPESPTTPEPAAQPSTSRSPSGDPTRAGSSQLGGVAVADRPGALPVAKDPPGTPPFLPRDEEIGAWIRHAPARVYGPNALAESIDDKPLLAALGPFSIKHATVCAYRWESGGKPKIARLMLLETETVLDALGVLTVHCLAVENARAGAVTPVARNGTNHFYAWQGNFLAHVSTTAGDEEFLTRCRRFLEKLTFRIPSDEVPAWLALLPAQGQLPGHRWVVRRTASLQGTSGKNVPIGDPKRVDELLGLGRDGVLELAAYAVPGEELANYVWLACYPDAEHARTAYDRYKKFLDTSNEPHALNTMLEPARGRFLLGTWTADQESIAHMLPRIAKTLPK